MDFGSLVNIFGVAGALLASAVIAFYSEAVVAGPTHRRSLKTQEEDHLRELEKLEKQYQERLNEKDRIIVEKTADGKEWQLLYRRVLSTLERQTGVSENAIAVARKASGLESDTPPV